MKAFEVTAHSTHIYKLRIEAKSKKEAIQLARYLHKEDDAWKEIYEDYNFNIVDAEEMDMDDAESC